MNAPGSASSSPFIFFYLLALLDAMAAWFLRERTTRRA
jgi:hypothetical protein